MSSSKDFLNFVLNQLSELKEVSHRAMMGEYILYYRGRIVGGIYDDMLLVKPVKSAKVLLPNAEMVQPYDGAKEMLLVPESCNADFLQNLFISMYSELPEPKKKK